LIGEYYHLPGVDRGAIDGRLESRSQSARVQGIFQSPGRLQTKRLLIWFCHGEITVMEIDLLRSIEKVTTGVHMHMFVVTKYIEGDIRTTCTELSR